MPQPPAPAAPPETLPEAERAFEEGDWRTARALAAREVDSPDEGRRAAAREMASRFTADRQLVALFVAALLFFALACWGWLRR